MLHKENQMDFHIPDFDGLKNTLSTYNKNGHSPADNSNLLLIQYFYIEAFYVKERRVCRKLPFASHFQAMMLNLFLHQPMKSGREHLLLKLVEVPELPGLV